MHSNLLKDKVALITGGAGGIGLAVASAYCRNGASVVLTDFNEHKLLEAKKKLQGPVLPLALDVTDEDQTQSVLDCAIEKYGKIDIVVPNAGILHLANFLDTETKDFKNLIETNLVGAFITAKICSHQLLAQNHGGRIIFTSSLFGLTGGRENSAYSASKFGMIGLMQCIAAELAEYQILANCVCPGQMQTDMIEKLFKERSKITGKPASEVKKALLNKIPMGKLGSMSDLAGTYLYLASDLSNYVTGQSFVVDGGWQVS